MQANDVKLQNLIRGGYDSVLGDDRKQKRDLPETAGESICNRYTLMPCPTTRERIEYAATRAFAVKFANKTTIIFCPLCIARIYSFSVGVV